MDFSLTDLAESKPVLSTDNADAALYDFQGEYGDTWAFIIKMKVVTNKYLGTIFDDLPPSPPALPGVALPNIEIDFTAAGIPIHLEQKGVDLTDIQNILAKYDGLKLRSLPVYVYASGPNKIFENDNVTISVTALNGDNPAESLPGANLLSEQPVSPQAPPVFPDSEDVPMTGTLFPKPKTFFDLKDILNQDNPPGKLDFDYKINIGNITVKHEELPGIREDFKTPLSVALVLVLPFQFMAGREIPILSEKNAGTDAGAIHLLEEGEDFFGRNSADDETGSSVEDLLERMQSLVIHVNIENNLGVAGYLPVYSAKPNPGDPTENLLGKMDLSGSSGIAVSKSKTVYPFNLWVEMYIAEGQEFDIKRPAENPDVPPLKLSLAVVVKTRIKETF
ncbi:MAG: hypothetical protein LBP80_05485 [Treponema sp.]|nr:hypothetical protein [Treponema sp.]